MDMSVGATGANAQRASQKPANAAQGTPFADAARQTLPAPTDGKPVTSLPGFHKLSKEEEAAFAATYGLDSQNLQASLSAMERQMLEMQEYYKFETHLADQNRRMQDNFFAKMRKWLGGPETGIAVPNDALGPEPVRTSSGGVHPQSERIKDYIRAHQDEWNTLQSFKPPSFEEWRQMRR